ncbi:O-acyltransferase like protein-like [Pecten maximus]|uniref:O-acyltransferase like protein-like n=1 Tax=Pecten maximus TaxID=6579 RepID=UPI0014590BB0|nr:O-acyltransferase like protein-like [Pecten maximus]
MRTLLVAGAIFVFLCVADIHGDVTTTKPKSQNIDYISLLEKGIANLMSNVSTQGIPNLSDLTSLFPKMDVQNFLKILQRLNVSIPTQSQSYAALNFLNSSLSRLKPIGESIQSSFQASQNYQKMLSPACNAAMGTLGSQLLSQKQWALQMIDSWGKPRAGLLEGNIKWRGMYDECMDTVAEVDGKIAFETNSCGANIPTPLMGPTGKVEIIIGMCLPSACVNGDPYLIADSFLSFIPTTPKLTTNFAWCQTEPDYDLRTTITICVCGAFLALITLATLFEILVVHPYQKNISKIPVLSDITASKPTPEDVKDVKVDIPMKPGVIQTMDHKPAVATKYKGLCSKLLLSFSAWSNGRKLLNAEQAGGSMGAINGIRFFSMSWVILGHTYIFLLLQQAMVNAYPFAKRMLERRTFMVITNGLLSVDTFFTLSGLLLAYVFMKEMKREKGRINWFMFYFHRFWRLTPPYMLVMMLDIVLFRYLGDGPMWTPDGLETDYCKESWWTNLLYVNNFVKTDKTCFGWAWYLANDMQFYWISPVILVPLYFSKKIGSVIAFLFLLGTTIASGIVSKHYELPSTQYSIVPNPHSGAYFNKYYIKPYCRMGPYIVGIMAGYILYRTKGKYKIKPPVNVFIWIVITVVACLVTYGPYEETMGNWMSVDVAALYNATHKSLWGVCVSWVIFACVTGNGGFINTFLSWSPFIPLGRLSYCAYLVHPIIMFVYMRSLRQAVYATDFVMIYLFLGHLVTAYLVAFVVSLAFESPMMGLEKAIFRRGEKKKQ